MVREKQRTIGGGAPASPAAAASSRPIEPRHLVDRLVRWLVPRERHASSADISEHLMRDIAFTRADIDLLVRSRAGMI
jgi:uncharacterized protein YjiS (DUF1127 family)